LIFAAAILERRRRSQKIIIAFEDDCNMVRCLRWLAWINIFVQWTPCYRYPHRPIEGSLLSPRLHNRPSLDAQAACVKTKWVIFLVCCFITGDSPNSCVAMPVIFLIYSGSRLHQVSFQACLVAASTMYKLPHPRLPSCFRSRVVE
jgi:hypothetical protein